MNETLRGDRLAIQATHPYDTGDPAIADTIVDYVLFSLDMHQVRSQLTLRSLPSRDQSDSDLRATLATEYQKDINDGWWLDPYRHMLLKHVNDTAGITQETMSVVGRRLGYIIPVNEQYKFIFKVGLSGSEDLPLALRPDDIHMDYSLGMDIEIEAIMADASNNHIGGPLIRSARTLLCRPHGGDVRLVFGLQLEDMHKMGLVYCQPGREVQGSELRLSGDAVLFPRGFLRWLDGDVFTDGERLWPGGPTQKRLEEIRRGRLQ